MRRLIVVGVLAALIGAVLPVGSAFGGSGLEGRWHRNNGDTEHEVLTCNGSKGHVVCHYNKVPEPAMDWARDGITGKLVGHIVEAGECPAYMAGPCASAVVIAQGTMYFNTGLVVDETIAVQEDGSMVLSWDNRPVPFHCPWYRSFDTALSEPAACSFFP